MPSREELESHPVTTLKKEISKTNIKGYSKMKKTEIVELMLKNKSRFHHIKMAEKKPKEEKPKPTPAPKEEKPKPTPAPKPVEKPKEKAKPAPSTTDCFNAHLLAKRVIEFYKENKGIFSKDKYLIKNKKELEEKIQFIKKILNDPRCENVKMTPPFRPFLEEALKLHLEKTKPKPKPKAKEDKPLLDLSKLKINNGVLNYNNNNVEIIASLLDDEFYLDVFSSQSKKSKPRAPRGEANMVLCEIIKHLLKNESKYGLNKKSKFRLEAGELEDVENFNQQKLNKYYMTLGFKKDIKESNATDKTIFTQPISGFIKNCMKFDKDVLSGKKPKPKVDIDKIENTIIDEIEKPIKKNKYDDAIDIYDLLDLGDFKRPQRERALKIIQKIIKTTGTEKRFPEVDVKKRLKL